MESTPTTPTSSSQPNKKPVSSPPITTSPAPKSKLPPLLIFLTVILLFLTSLLIWKLQPAQSSQPTASACTEETKICPDGSAVSRTGPDCEFAECPVAPSPTIDPTANWQIYNSSEDYSQLDGNFSFQYPPMWKVKADKTRIDLMSTEITDKIGVEGPPGTKLAKYYISFDLRTDTYASENIAIEKGTRFNENTTELVAPKGIKKMSTQYIPDYFYIEAAINNSGSANRAALIPYPNNAKGYIFMETIIWPWDESQKISTKSSPRSGLSTVNVLWAKN